MRKLKVFVLLFVAVCLAMPPFQTVSAVSDDSIYVYDLQNASTTVANEAAANPNVNLTLVGDWSSDDEGVTFQGNTSNLQSSSYAKPASGSTFSATASQSVGAAVVFRSATGCYSDSQNVTQIGFFANNTTQIKLQLSKCTGGQMFPECRFAGSLSTSTTSVLRGTPSLVTGKQYRLECVKAGDQSSNAQVTMRTTDIETGQVYQNSFTIPRTGTMSSTSHLSVGAKYPLASQSNNTDQFRGSVTRVGYCKSSSVAEAQACLEADVPAVVDLGGVSLTPPSLVSSITDQSQTREPGETYNYTVSLENIGEQAATNTQLSAHLPDSLSIVDADGGVQTANVVTWGAGTVVGGANFTRVLKVTLAGSTLEATPVPVLVSAAAAEPEACGSSAACVAEDIDMVVLPPVVPPATELVTNTSVETSLDGWTGKYAGHSTIAVTRSTEQAYAGAASIKVAGLSGASNRNSGFNDNPDIITNATAGRTYDASVWVKPAFSGQEIVLRLREWSGGVSIGDRKVTLVANGTGWQQITNQITATQNGSRLAFVVYGEDIDAGEYFYVDNLSLKFDN